MFVDRMVDEGQRKGYIPCSASVCESVVGWLVAKGSVGGVNERGRGSRRLSEGK